MSSKHPIPNPAARRAAIVRDTTRAVRAAVIDVLVNIGYAEHGDCAPLLVPRAAEPGAPARMAAEHVGDDAARRDELQAAYRRCLDTYRRVVRPDDALREVDDAGAAVAFFVATNLHALHGADLPPDALAALERQLRGVARQRANWEQASVAERQFFFERIAILAVLVAGSHAQLRPGDTDGAASVRRTARQYLSQMLGLNPDLLTLGAGGLAARHAAVRRAA